MILTEKKLLIVQVKLNCSEGAIRGSTLTVTCSKTLNSTPPGSVLFRALDFYCLDCISFD